jgi:hypothetical protein
LSSGKPDTGTVKNASTWSYIMGIWYFVAVIVVMVATYAVLLPFISTFASGGVPNISQIVDMFRSLLLPVIVVAVITVPTAIVFGYFLYKVGKMYRLSSLQISGISVMIVSAAILPIVYGLYQLIEAIQYIAGLTATQILNSINTSLDILIMSAGLAALFGVIFLITFIIGASGMKNATGISDFKTAMWLAIAGLFVSFLFPIAVLLFGTGLSRLAKQGVEREAGAPTLERGATMRASRQAIYCPYCGAKVEPDALFCLSCGSSLKKEG